MHRRRSIPIGPAGTRRAVAVRKGRFDEVFFVDLPEPDERVAILAIHLRRHHQDPTAFDLPAIAAATAGFSGAELERVVVNGLLRSLQERRPADPQLLLDEAAALVPLSGLARRGDRPPARRCRPPFRAGPR